MKNGIMAFIFSTRKIFLFEAVTCLFAFSQFASANFVDVSEQVGLSTELKKSWGNPVWGDLNNDGFLDLIVPTHGLSASHGPFVYLNNGGTSFTDIRNTSGIGKAPTFDTGDWHGYALGDYDSDGNLDLYIAEGAKGNVGGADKRDVLFHGNGNGTFTYVSDAAGVQITQHRGRGGMWFDYDNSGSIKLFVKNYGGENDLYEWTSGLFLVPGAAGLEFAASGNDFGSIVAVADYDNDGYMDMAITGDSDSEALYRNQNGNFVDVTGASGIQPLRDCKGIAWGDYNNDGFVDLFVARGTQGSSAGGVVLYRNNKNGTFTDVSAAAGLSLPGNYWSGVWGDFDNDGYLDLFLPNAGDNGDGPGNANRLFHNNQDGTFTDIATEEGISEQDNITLHKTVAAADFNDDGFLDLLIKDGLGSEKDNGAGASGRHRLFRNNPNGNHFLKINLLGTRSNRNGIGARVTVSTLDTQCFRQNNGDGGGNNDSQGSGPLNFGIGASDQVAITVVWPSGTVDTLQDVAANSTITVVEGGGPTPTPTPTPTPAPPVITKQPANRRVGVGQPAKFIVMASGAPPLAYQWKKNGAPVPGATSSTYLTPPTTLADNGSEFVVVVSNLSGSATSRKALLGVSPVSAGAR